jgi:hypothetical protein
VTDPRWPPDGLPLAEALWRIEPDPQAFDLGLFSPMVAASSVCRQRAGRLCALVREGSYRIKGRRGSLTALPEEIPASAVPYLDFAHSDRSELRERIPNGQRWYDVRVEHGAPLIEQVEPTAQPKDKGGSRGVWDWPLLARDLQQITSPFPSKTEFNKYCRENVQRADRAPCGDGPHPKTVRTAIKNHRLDRYVTIAR